MARSTWATYIAIGLLAGFGGSCTSATVNADPARAGDPAYVFARVEAVRDAQLVHVAEPDSLSESLPNRKITVQTAEGPVAASWSDLVLTGTITSVAPGTAIKYLNVEPTTSANEEAFTTVPFEDKTAHERNVVLTVRPDWSAGEKVGDEVLVRMGVIGGGDPDEFMAGLRGLQDGRIVMLLDTRESGRHVGDYYPIMGGALLGRVSPEGALEFAGLGSRESAFLGTIDHVGELRREAEAPVEVIPR